MIKILSDNYFCVQRPGRVDVYTLGQKCEVVRAAVCTTPNEAIAWVNRKENRHG